MTSPTLGRAPRERLWLGRLPIDPLTRDQALDAIEGLVLSGAGGTVFTPNVDHVVVAESDAAFRRAYADTSLSLVDGVPVLLAARLLGYRVPAKVSGADLVRPLVERAAARGWRVYLVGGGPGVAERAAALLTAHYPGLVIAGFDACTIELDAPPAERAAMVERARQAVADVILVALGSPKGERWAAEAHAALQGPVIVGIGAGLDFLVGAQRRAPSWISAIGLEWLFRLAREPRRLWRRYLVRGPRFLPILARDWRSDGAAARRDGSPASRMPRVAFLTPEFPGQTHSFIWRERLFLQEAGFEVRIVSTRPPPRGIVCQAWAPVAQAETTYMLPIGIAGLLQALLGVLRAGPRRALRALGEVARARGLTPRQHLRLLLALPLAARLAGLSHREGWSHLHVHSCAEAAHLALLASRLSGISYSLAFLGPSLRVYGPNQANKWRHARFATVMSQAMLEEVQREIGSALPKRVEVAPLGVDTQYFRRRTAFEPWRAGESCLIYSCGRLNPVKGHVYLIDAVLELRLRGVAAQLEIAGEDEQGGRGYRSELERFIAQRKAHGFVRLLGAVSEIESRERLERARLFALASLDEGVSVAVMEAMSMELPTVCTRVGGMHELVDSGIDAVLVPPRDPAALAQALFELLQEPDRAARLGARGRLKVESRFDHRIGARTLVRCLTDDGVLPR